MNEFDKKVCIEEEVFVVQHSGEIPEVTLHESIYHLTEDLDGPGLMLDNKDIFYLKQAVISRYRTIILRDLDPANRDKSIYRGLARCMVNWQRLEKFCYRENMDFRIIQNETANALKKFFDNEIKDMQSGSRSSCINCSHHEIETFVSSLGFPLDDMPKGWQKMCPSK